MSNDYLEKLVGQKISVVINDYSDRALHPYGSLLTVLVSSYLGTIGDDHLLGVQLTVDGETQKRIYRASELLSKIII